MTAADSPADTTGLALEVELASRLSTADPGAWEIAWNVRNVTSEPLQVHSAWLPHGRFRAPRRLMEPTPVVGPGAHISLDFSVQCREEPGTIVENCFVILNVGWNDADWQVFARLTVTFDEEGAPLPETVLITSQRTGFAHNT